MPGRPHVGTTQGTTPPEPKSGDRAGIGAPESPDAENRPVAALETILASHTDCEMWCHPLIDGHECPCGQNVKPAVSEPEPTPVVFHQQVSVWWAGVPDRQYANRPKRTKTWPTRLAPRRVPLVNP